MTVLSLKFFFLQKCSIIKHPVHFYLLHKAKTRILWFFLCSIMLKYDFVSEDWKIGKIWGYQKFQFRFMEMMIVKHFSLSRHSDLGVADSTIFSQVLRKTNFTIQVNYEVSRPIVRQKYQNFRLDNLQANLKIKEWDYQKTSSSFQKQPPEVQEMVLLEISGLRPTTLLKKRLWRRCFPVNFLRTPFYIERLWWLLLIKVSWNRVMTFAKH